MEHITVYAIKEISTGEIIYIGSTVQTLSKRMSHHLTYAFKEKYSEKWNRKLYSHIREICDRGSFYEFFEVEEIGSAEVNSHKEQLRIERGYIDDYKPVCNDVKPYLNEEEKKKQHAKCNQKWAAENPERMKELQTRWYKNHPEKHAEYNRRWREKQKNRNISQSVGI